MKTETNISDHIHSLKEILIRLKPDGLNGFEGLIRTALSEIAGVPFRLASSGSSQSGVDGKSTYADDGISFECKRYKDPVPRGEIRKKIADITLESNDTDLWVLCATSEISSQIADDMAKFDKESAVSTLILDWSEDDLPPLAVALTMASVKVRSFLHNYIAPKMVEKATAAFVAIENDPNFEGHAKRIRASLREPTLGMDTARQANTNWLTKTFSNKQLAKRHFYQPLSPLDETNRVVHPRDNLVAEMSPYLTGEPSKKILCVLGGEGNGKSWLVAQSWLSVEEKPLMVVLSPSADMEKRNNVQELLISALIEQTGDHSNDLLEKKWSRILAQWRKQSVERLRLVVLIDGLNQRRKMDWGRILERFSAELELIGGQLIITARTQYYQDHVKQRLISDPKKIEIPEWTECERDGILADCEIVAANLHSKVAASLRNPRLLGIALELLEGAAITRLEELNVSRLLFEHIRLSERDAPTPQPVHEFVQQLRMHAKEVISRIQAKQEGDLVVFEHDPGDLNAVAYGRFFHPIQSDATRYTLKENGLTLALGFAVIDRLQFANNHNLNDELEKIIDPIASLDRTTNVILAALTVTCIDDKYPDAFATALIQMFANLQNPDEAEFDSFAHLARTRPTPFMEAAHDLCLSGGYQINFDWIQAALIEARADTNAWKKIFKDIKIWLSYYTPPAEIDLAQGTSETSKNKTIPKKKEKQKSLGSAIREHLQKWGESWIENIKTWLSYYTPPAEGDAAQDISETLKNKTIPKKKEKQKSLGSAIREHLQAQMETRREEEEKEREQRTRENIEALSEAEKEILSKLTEIDGDLNTLSRFAFILLAGKPIEPAAQALVQWSFANALNVDLMPLDQEFRHLIQFNQVDWSDTRVALLKEVNVLRQNETSTTGKRALINILRATGSPEDAKQARELDELSENRTHTYSLRRVEIHCATDPCDPRSEKPDNVKQTAQKYKEIDVSTLWVSMGKTSEDYFLDKARPGMARFEPDVAKAKHREFARDVMQRKELRLLLGLLGLWEHNALLSRERGLAFANLQESEYTDESDLSERDRWRISEYRFLLAFPFLSGREQIDTLLSTVIREGGIPSNFMYKLKSVAKSVEETVFDNLLESACQNEDEHAQYVLLAFARETLIPISEKSRKHIACLLKAQSKRVRVQALGLIAQLDDVNLLAKVVHSVWQASESNQHDENVYGSAILTKAATDGIIGHSDALDRMLLSYYGRAAHAWSSTEAQDAVRAVALRVNAAICSVANIGIDLAAPDIEIHVGLEDSLENLISFPDKPVDLAEQLMRLTESDEAVEERQKRRHDAYLAFRDRLTDQQCDIILGNFYLYEFRTIVEANEVLANQWYEMLINMPEARLPAVHNLILHLAYALSISNPDKAVELFHKVRDSKSLARVTYYYTAVSLDAVSIWRGPDAKMLNGLRFQRLDRAANDHELSQEVLVAHLNDKQDLLRQYIEAKLKKEEPAEIARAIMVVGFSDYNEFNDDILSRYQGTDGFIGDAHNAAQYAYERNFWARHWFAKMCEADEADEFWRFSILFAKIVDRRYAFWQSEYTEKNEPMQLFWSSVRSKLKNRFDRWESLRKEKLFGGDAPEEIFLLPRITE